MPRVPNICDYAQTSLDPFSARPLGRVDSLVLSWLSYFRLPDEARRSGEAATLTVRDLFRAEWFEPMCGAVFDPARSVGLLAVLAASPRFRDVVVSDHVDVFDTRVEQQFSATTFQLPTRDAYVAFRGTDNTLVGWKEDLNMSFATAVPSQLAAARYLADVAGSISGRVYAGGHSKGGNLAVYAAVMGEAAKSGRLVRVFSHDGPGFPAAVRSDERWHQTQAIVDKTIPQSSVVGMLFEGQETACTLVRSDAVGFWQHDPFSWEVSGCDFAVADRRGMGASTFDASVNAWLESSTSAERERFVDAVFTVLDASGASSLKEIKADWRRALPRMAAAIAALDPDERAVVSAAVRSITGGMGPGARQALDALAPTWR